LGGGFSEQLGQNERKSPERASSEGGSGEKRQAKGRSQGSAKGGREKLTGGKGNGGLAGTFLLRSSLGMDQRRNKNQSKTLQKQQRIRGKISFAKGGASSQKDGTARWGGAQKKRLTGCSSTEDSKTGAKRSEDLKRKLNAWVPVRPPGSSRYDLKLQRGKRDL